MAHVASVEGTRRKPGLPGRLLPALLVALSLVPLISTPAQALGLSDYFTYSYTVQFSKTEVARGEPFSATAQASASCRQTLPVTLASVSFTGRVVAVHQTSGTRVTLNPSYNVALSPFPYQQGQSTQASTVVPLQFPESAAYGAYSVSGELIEARMETVTWFGNVWVPVPAGLLPSSRDMGTVNFVAPSGSGATGGGAGAGDSGGNQPTVISTVTTTGFAPPATALTVDNAGVVQQTSTLNSANGKASVTLPQSTTMLNASGQALTSIVATDPGPGLPPAPANSALLTACDLGPNGATFSPPITVAFKFNPSDVPQGLSSNDLKLAFWDGSGWQIIPNSQVDLAANQVSAQVSHFTSFAIIARPALPAPSPTPTPTASATAAPKPSPTPTPSVTTRPVPAPKPTSVTPAPTLTPSPAPVPAPSPQPLPQPVPPRSSVSLPLLAGLASAGIILGAILWWASKRRF